MNWKNPKTITMARPQPTLDQVIVFQSQLITMGTDFLFLSTKLCFKELTVYTQLLFTTSSFCLQLNDQCN